MRMISCKILQKSSHGNKVPGTGDDHDHVGQNIPDYCKQPPSSSSEGSGLFGPSPWRPGSLYHRSSVVHPFIALTPVGGRVGAEVPIPEVPCGNGRSSGETSPSGSRSRFPPLVRKGLTDARNDVELVVDLLVHGGADDADSGEGVGHRVDAHLSHEQRQQEDLVLRHVVVLQVRQRRRGGPQPPGQLLDGGSGVRAADLPAGLGWP